MPSVGLYHIVWRGHNRTGQTDSITKKPMDGHGLQYEHPWQSLAQGVEALQQGEQTIAIDSGKAEVLARVF